MTTRPATDHKEPLSFPVPLVCPNCRKPGLVRQGDDILCNVCSHQYGVESGFLDLIIGNRFEDQSDDTCLCYEDVSNEYTAEHFWIPQFRSLWPDRERPVRLLAVGCGTGMEVDMLHEAGFEVVGIEIGNRTRIWPKRKARDWLMLANGMHLPFSDETFDGVFCGCVFPHVGVIGDSFEVTEHYREDRLALASEMTRVLKKEGRLIAASPNRRFPFDIFHGRAPGSYLPRPNWPSSHFLLSFNDYRQMLHEAGCNRVSSRPATGYWGFVRSKHSLKGLLLGIPARLLFWISTNPALRTSVLAPWLIVDAHK